MNESFLSILSYLKAQGFKQQGETICGAGFIQLVLTRQPITGLFESISLFVLSNIPLEEEELEEEEAEQEEVNPEQMFGRRYAYRTTEVTELSQQNLEERG